MGLIQRLKRNAAFRKKVKTETEAEPESTGEPKVMPRLKAQAPAGQNMVAMYPGDEVMWRHPQGYCFVVQIVEVYEDGAQIRLTRNGEIRQLRVSPNSLSVTLAQARMSARRRSNPQTRLVPTPSGLAVGKTVRWLRADFDPVLARVVEIHWSDTQAKICPVGQRLTCWVDVPTLEVVA